MKEKFPAKSFFIVLGALFVILIFLLTLLPKILGPKNVSAIKEAITLATTKKPETFTELYFENHTQLPTKIEKGKEYSFSFTIHNLENQDMVYPYTVYLQRDNVKTTIFQKIVTLKKDEYKTIEETVGPFKALRTMIGIELTDKNQNIDFWMDS